MRLPYHVRTTPAALVGDVDHLLDMAVWCERHGYYPEAYNYLRAALEA